MAGTCFKNNTWKLPVWRRYLETIWKMVFEKSLFEWWYLETTCSNEGIWKLLAWKDLIRKLIVLTYLFERQYMETTSSNEIISKLLIWMAALGKYLFKWRYLETTWYSETPCFNDGDWKTICSNDGICKILF